MIKFIFAVTFLFAGLVQASEIAKDSIYQVDNKWTDQENSSFQLSDLKGTPVIITMVYLSCPHTCPLTIAKLKEIEKKLSEKKLKGYQIVLVSFDYEHDRPQKLKAYMADKKLDPSRWKLLTAKNDDEVRALSIVLGINYRRLEDGDYSHSNIISVLDKEGRIISKIDRLSADDAVLVKAMESNFGNK